MMMKTYLSVCFAAFLALGILGIAAPHSAEAAAKPSGIGYINIQKIFAAHPDMDTVKLTMELEEKKAQQDFDKNAKDLPDKEKSEYADKLSRQIAEKEQSLMKPLRKKIFSAIEKVAKEKGVDSVIDASVMIFGGQDLTEDVVKALQ